MSEFSVEMILAPIEGEKRAGSSIRDSWLYRKVPRDLAGDSDDVIDHSDADETGSGTVKRNIDFDQIVEEVSGAIRHTSKDLQLSFWLTIALIGRDGFPGLAAGLDLITGLLTDYWEDLYPLSEKGDLSLRAAIFSKGIVSLVSQISEIPIIKRGGVEEPSRSPIVIASDFPLKELEKTAAGLALAIASFNKLSKTVEGKFRRDAPDWSPLANSLDEAKSLLNEAIALKQPKKVESQEDVRQLVPEASPTAESDIAAARWPEPKDPRVAIASLLKSVRLIDAENPSPYLAIRGLLWPELVLNGTSAWSAPASAIRKELESLFNTKSWNELLARSEDVFFEYCALLDLQRYSATACHELGYDDAANAIQLAAKQLLTSAPQLLKASFDDGTALANSVTQCWLEPLFCPVVNPEPKVPLQQVHSVHEVEPTSEGRNHSGIKRKCDVFQERLERALQLVENERFQIARPLLEDLAAEFERRSLLDWEGPARLLKVLIGLHYCLIRTGSSEGRQRAAFERICQLDPDCALSLAQEAGLPQ